MYLCNLYLYIIYAHAFHTIPLHTIPFHTITLTCSVIFLKATRFLCGVIILTRVIFLLDPLTRVQKITRHCTRNIIYYIF